MNLNFFFFFFWKLMMKNKIPISFMCLVGFHLKDSYNPPPSSLWDQSAVGVTVIVVKSNLLWLWVSSSSYSPVNLNFVYILWLRLLVFEISYNLRPTFLIERFNNTDMTKVSRFNWKIFKNLHVHPKLVCFNLSISVCRRYFHFLRRIRKKELEPFWWVGLFWWRIACENKKIKKKKKKKQSRILIVEKGMKYLLGYLKWLKRTETNKLTKARLKQILLQSLLNR